MNNWQAEVMAEYDRQRILQEVEQIRLEKLAHKSHAPRPRVFARTMVNLGIWMVAIGQRLCQRYEVTPKGRSKGILEG